MCASICEFFYSHTKNINGKSELEAMSNRTLSDTVIQGESYELKSMKCQRNGNRTKKIINNPYCKKESNDKYTQVKSQCSLD